MDIAQHKMRVGISKVPVVHLALLGIYIISKSNTPTGPFQAQAHQADPGEEFKEGFLSC